LFGFAVGELYVARIATVVLSLVTTPRVMDSFGTVVTAYQAIGGVVQSALQVPMVARARNRLGIERDAHPALFSVVIAMALAIPAALLVGLLAPWLTGRVLGLDAGRPGLWLILFMLALPFLAVTRAFMLNHIGDGDYRWSTRAVALLALSLSAAVALLIPLFGATGAAAATAAAEIITMVVLVAVLLGGSPPSILEQRWKTAPKSPR
jgi:O-antigen/teichoic acid export membrane protein